MVRKELRNKTTQDIGFSIHNKIFISESLTLKNRELLKKCLQFKKAANYMFIWTSSSKNYLRKDGRPESRATRVTSNKDLGRLSQAMQQYEKVPESCRYKLKIHFDALLLFVFCCRFIQL